MKLASYMENLSENINEVDTLEALNFLQAIKLPCVHNQVRKVFDINPNTWQFLKDEGKIRKDGTYEEILRDLFFSYKESSEAKALVAQRKAEEQAAKAAKRQRSDTESGLPPILEAEKVQNIRLARAKEREVHLKNLTTQSTLVNKHEMYDVMYPFVSTMANVLRSAADDEPKLRPAVDRCFETLFRLGAKLCEQVSRDKERYVTEMMEAPVDLQDIIDSLGVE